MINNRQLLDKTYQTVIYNPSEYILTNCKTPIIVSACMSSEDADLDMFAVMGTIKPGDQLTKLSLGGAFVKLTAKAPIKITSELGYYVNYVDCYTAEQDIAKAFKELTPVNTKQLNPEQKFDGVLWNKQVYNVELVVNIQEDLQVIDSNEYDLYGTYNAKVLSLSVDIQPYLVGRLLVEDSDEYGILNFDKKLYKVTSTDQFYNFYKRQTKPQTATVKKSQNLTTFYIDDFGLAVTSPDYTTVTNFEGKYYKFDLLGALLTFVFILNVPIANITTSNKVDVKKLSVNILSENPYIKYFTKGKYVGLPNNIADTPSVTFKSEYVQKEGRDLLLNPLVWQEVPINKIYFAPEDAE